MTLSVILPTLGRASGLRRAVASLVGKGLPPDVEVLVGYDPEEIHQQFDYPGVRIIETQQAVTLGRKMNAMAERAMGDYLVPFANDMIVTAPDWVARVFAAIDDRDNDGRLLHLADPIHPGFTTLPILSRKMIDAAGFFASPIFPFWFTDTWWDEIGELLGGRTDVDVGLQYPDGRGKSHGLRDLDFWAKVFEVTRPMRVRTALELLPEAEHAQVPLREAHARAKVAHLSHPDFVRQWEGNAEPLPFAREAAYRHAKAEASRILAKTPPKPTGGAPRVAICIPSGGYWNARCATAVTGLSAYSANAGLPLAICNLEGSVISDQRNSLVDIALQTESDYVFFIDSDMLFPPDALMRLLKHDKDVVGATYCKRVPPYETLGRLMAPRPTDEELAKGGLHEAAFLPGGMLLIKTDVFRKMPRPWFHEAYRWSGATGSEALKSFLRQSFVTPPPASVLDSIAASPLGEWLDTIWGDETKTNVRYRSEDMMFCQNVRRAGFRMWCDLTLTYEVKHMGWQEVTCLPPTLANSKALAVAAE